MEERIKQGQQEGEYALTTDQLTRRISKVEPDLQEKNAFVSYF